MTKSARPRSRNTGDPSRGRAGSLASAEGVGYQHRRELAKLARSGDVQAARELLELFARQSNRADPAGLVVRGYVARCIRAYLSRRAVSIDAAFNLVRRGKGRPHAEHHDLLHYIAGQRAAGHSARAASIAAARQFHTDARNAERIFKASGVYGEALIALAKRGNNS